MAAGHDAKPLDYDELERWTRVGYERVMRSHKRTVRCAEALERPEGTALPYKPHIHPGREPHKCGPSKAHDLCRDAQQTLFDETDCVGHYLTSIERKC